MKKYSFKYLAVLLTLAVTSCKPEFTDDLGTNELYTSGEADFGVYVAVGNSLTAGYMDGTVYASGQKYSFPNILAQQFAKVGGGKFTQPSYADDTGDLGGLTFNGTQIPEASKRLVFSISKKTPEEKKGASTVEVTQQQKKAFHNMGIPGARSFELLFSGYGALSGMSGGTANPYFVRTATSDAVTVIGDALSLNPTFFTLWIGSNDVLSYAASGGTGVDQKGNSNPKSYGLKDITDPDVFENTYKTLLDQLVSKGAKGVVGTIPDVSSIPFFTTISYNILLLEADKAAELNSAYLAYNTALDDLLAGNYPGLTAEEVAKRKIVFSEGANGLVIVDESLTDLTGGGLLSMRQATSDDLILITASDVLQKLKDPSANTSTLEGLTSPLEDKWVLTADEISKIRDAVTSYNTAIKELAEERGIAVTDMNTAMKQLASESGLTVEDGTVYTSDYFSEKNMSSVLFSLDGVHPNARGYAVIANLIIKDINSYYKANIPLVNAANYPGITLVP